MAPAAVKTVFHHSSSAFANPMTVPLRVRSVSARQTVLSLSLRSEHHVRYTRSSTLPNREAMKPSGTSGRNATAKTAVDGMARRMGGRLGRRRDRYIDVAVRRMKSTGRDDVIPAISHPPHAYYH